MAETVQAPGFSGWDIVRSYTETANSLQVKVDKAAIEGLQKEVNETEKGLATIKARFEEAVSTSGMDKASAQNVRNAFDAQQKKLLQAQKAAEAAFKEAQESRGKLAEKTKGLDETVRANLPGAINATVADLDNPNSSIRQTLGLIGDPKLEKQICDEAKKFKAEMAAIDAKVAQKTGDLLKARNDLKTEIKKNEKASGVVAIANEFEALTTQRADQIKTLQSWQNALTKNLDDAAWYLTRDIQKEKYNLQQGQKRLEDLHKRQQELEGQKPSK